MRSAQHRRLLSVRALIGLFTSPCLAGCGGVSAAHPHCIGGTNKKMIIIELCDCDEERSNRRHIISRESHLCGRWVHSKMFFFLTRNAHLISLLNVSRCALIIIIIRPLNGDSLRPPNERHCRPALITYLDIQSNVDGDGKSHFTGARTRIEVTCSVIFLSLDGSIGMLCNFIRANESLNPLPKSAGIFTASSQRVSRMNAEKNAWRSDVTANEHKRRTMNGENTQEREREEWKKNVYEITALVAAWKITRNFTVGSTCALVHTPTIYIYIYFEMNERIS